MQQSVVIVEAISNGRWYAREARERGFLPVVVHPRLEHAPQCERARERSWEYLRDWSPLVIDEPEDFAGLVDQIRALRPACVVAGSESGVPFADKLAHALGLPCNAPDSSALRRDKHLMQAALAGAGLRHIRGGVVHSPQEASDLARSLGTWPLVVKPLAGAATVGVHFCHNDTELRAHTKELLEARDLFGAANTGVLVQERILGAEYIVNTVSCAGRHMLTDIWMYNKLPIGSKGNAYDYAKLITRLEPGQASLLAYAFAALSAMGYVYGPSHMEIMVDAQGPVLIEAGARPMGGDISEGLLRESLGHCLVDLALDSYLAPQAFARREFAPYRAHKQLMIKYLVAPEAMRVDCAPALPLLRRLPSVRDVQYHGALQTHETPKTVDLITSPGHVLLCHQDEATLLEDYRLIRTMEVGHFTLLLADKENFQPSRDLPAMTQALRNLLKNKEMAKGCLVVLDAEMGDINLPDVPTVAFNDIATLPEHLRYQRIVLHSGNRATDLETYLENLNTLTQRLAPGGVLLCTPWGTRGSGSGPVGTEIIFRLLGLSIEPPLVCPVPILRGKR